MKLTSLKVLVLAMILIGIQSNANAQNSYVWGLNYAGQLKANKVDFFSLYTQRNYYGAIAFSQSTGATGGAWDHYSEGEAARAAVSSCGRSDCRAVYVFWNTCGALAVGDGGGWGTGRGPNRYDAEMYARVSCRNAGNTNCRDYYYVCTTRY